MDKYDSRNLGRYASNATVALYLDMARTELVREYLAQGILFCDIIDKALADPTLPDDCPLKRTFSALTTHTTLADKFAARDRVRASLLCLQNDEDIEPADLTYLQEYFSNMASTFLHLESVHRHARTDNA